MREPLPADKQETFVALFAKHQSAGADFWKDVEKAGFTATEVKDVQTSLKLAVLTRNHVPLIKELQNLQDSDIRNLARLNRNEWVELAKRHGVPEGTPGATEKEQLQNYADQLAQSIELSYPTAVIAARVQNGPSLLKVKHEKIFPRSLIRMLVSSLVSSQ
jgi:hypothetical protein